MNVSRWRIGLVASSAAFIKAPARWLLRFQTVVWCSADESDRPDL